MHVLTGRLLLTGGFFYETLIPISGVNLNIFNIVSPLRGGGRSEAH